jgi:cytochrome oxidase assembly protein ShyY1
VYYAYALSIKVGEDKQSKMYGPRATTWPFYQKVLFLTPIAGTFALGCWQWQRKSMKETAIAERRALLSDEPTEATSPPFQPFGRYLVQGTTSGGAPLFVGPRMSPSGGANGHYMYVPVTLTSGRTVIVNVGWTAADSKAHWANVLQQPICLKTEAIYRHGDDRPVAMPENNMFSNEWFYADTQQMARKMERDAKINGVHDDGLFEMVNGGKLWAATKKPEDFLTFPTMPEKHTVYAMTWWGLSASMSVLAVMRFMAK